MQRAKAWGQWLLGCGVALTLACVSGAPDTDPPEGVQPFIVDQVPDGVTPLNANFADKLSLVGVEVTPEGKARPGERVHFKLYWRVLEPLGESGWKLFTHVLDASGDRLLNIDNVGPLRRLRRNQQAWPPSRWQKGKVYVDEQNFLMPRKVKSATVQIVTGIWKGRQRQKLSGGPSAGGDRALVATLETGRKGKRGSTRVPRLQVAMLAPEKSLRIDGKLDDAGWAEASETGAFVNVRTGAPHPEAPVGGSARMLWDETHLYLGFEVRDANLTGGFDPKQTDPRLWTKDCVEIMLDPDGNGDNRDYYEIQINPQNLVFDSRFDSYNRPKKEPDGPFGHQDWSAGVVSAVTLKGTLDDASDRDEGYVVEAKIPWASFGKAKQAPPRPGDTWRVNLYAMEDNGGVAWSPIRGEGNFHKASRFGRVTWVKERSPRRRKSRTQAAASQGTAAARP